MFARGAASKIDSPEREAPTHSSNDNHQPHPDFNQPHLINHSSTIDQCICELLDTTQPEQGHDTYNRSYQEHANYHNRQTQSLGGTVRTTFTDTILNSPE